MYVANYIDQQLFNLQQFENELTADGSKLNIFRNALQQGQRILKTRFQATHNATEYVNQRTWLVDQMILQIHRQLCTCPDINQVALIAVGGYGRGELHPGSDIDLLFLLSQPPSLATQNCIERFITFLWDIRLEVGQSVRTLSECEQQVVHDISVATNLMEARLITGSADLFKEMQLRLSSDNIWKSKDFFAAKLAEQKQRHLKYHDTAYNLEPNIKEGPGGLRDIQTIAWVAKRHFNASTLHDLVGQGFITEKECHLLIKGQAFLWQIRCFLHLLANRREDRLLFDYQRTLATALGYADDEAGLGVEKLMKQYYRTAKKIMGLNEMLLQLFQEAILYAGNPTTLYFLNKRFQVRNDFIEVTHDKVFAKYPFALLEIFLLMQQHPEIKGIRAMTIRLILHYIYLIDKAFHRDLRVRSLFYEIIHQPQGLTHALRRMNSYGILAAYIPAFGRIVGQMQYDLYHVYTVDQHSIFVVRNLRRFSIPQYIHEFPLSSKIIQSIPKPELLYLAGLFHDIGKGRGGDHSELGEKEALNFCQAHGLSDNDTRLVAWLVRHHLLMSITAQRQDTSDPKVIKSFAQRIEEPIRLDYLYLLTVADIRATNPNLWNSWKDKLLADLYHKTRAALLPGNTLNLDKQIHIQDIKINALQLLNDIEQEHPFLSLWEDLGDDYFLYSSPEEIVRETQTILNHLPSTVPLILERQNLPGSMAFITLYPQDRDDLFAKTTHFLEQQDLTIVDAYIVPTQLGYIMSGYTVLADEGTSLDLHSHSQMLLQSLKEELTWEANSAFPPIQRHLPRQLKHFPVPTRITFTQDQTNDHTVLELITTDRPGVLSRVAQAFMSSGVLIKKAKIATFGSRVEDIFFITDYKHHALYSADQLDYLRERLSLLLDEDMPKQSTTSVTPSENLQNSGFN
ncbi:MAG: [protein-PII] uridylyltransferase [Thioploca sp.]|nr:[protein-PII] uridylyltransferase [Thioploca sp.]